jgi:hypothetical protein
VCPASVVRYTAATCLRALFIVPLTITGSTIKNLKELRPGSSGTSEVRILLVFDPWRSAILLVAGDKSGKWSRWYAEAIPRAEQLYEIYLKERAEEESGR